MDVKRELISSIKPFFGLSYPDKDFANKINVTLDWPQEPVHLPTILITYTEGPIRNMGVGHVEMDSDDNGVPITYKHFQFDGQVNFNVLALSPIERDRIAAGLINLLAFNDVIPEFGGFLDEVSDNDYVSIVINPDNITPHGENTAPVPWGNPDEMIFGNTYSIQMHGEFYSNADTGELIEISSVAAWPYRPGEQPHWTP
jgi:hypothetical protein